MKQARVVSGGFVALIILFLFGALILGSGFLILSQNPSVDVKVETAQVVPKVDTIKGGERMDSTQALLTEQIQTSKPEPETKIAPETNKLAPEANKPDPETSNWKEYHNSALGFKFLYPPTWITANRLKESDGVFVYNQKPIFVKGNLPPPIMFASFSLAIRQHTGNTKQAYIDWIIENREANKGIDTGFSVTTGINPDTIKSIPNQYGLDILRFEGGTSDVEYSIPVKKDFTNVISVIVLRPDPLLEKMLYTFHFDNTE